jgi:hypothetical protein
MVRRLVSIALTFLVAAVPAAADMCAAQCAEHASEVRDASHHQHHHHAGAAKPMTVAGMQGLPHTCASADPLAAQSRESLRIAPDKSSVLVAAPLASPPPAVPLAARLLDDRHGPPRPVRTIAPLRI